LAYDALTMLQETLDAYGIVRKEKVYGKTLRVSVQNKTQLQKINDVIELILVTEEINIEEIAFPEWPNHEKKFMLYIKGSPHHEIESVFAQTDIKWRICEVDHKLPENENEPYIYTYDFSMVSENGGNEATRQKDNDDFLEAQYKTLVTNTMMKMKISKTEAENQIQIWFQWRMQDEQNNERLAVPVELNTEIKKHSEKDDTRYTDNTGELNSFQEETYLDNGGASSNGSSFGQVVTRFLSRSASRTGCFCIEDFSDFYILTIFCLKLSILVCLIILIFILSNEQHSSNLKNNIQEIF